MAAIDLKGMKFGMLTVVDRGNNSKEGRARWNCICECGQSTLVMGKNLRNGDTGSCGCRIGGRTHGMSSTRIYKVWTDMKIRCRTSGSPKYKNYGERGIEICDEWYDDFVTFYDWAIKNGYEETLTIDRIDVNGDYEPDNCRWATMKEQASNKRDTLYIDIEGERKSCAAWAEMSGLTTSCIHHRHVLYGWSGGALLQPPLRGKNAQKLWSSRSTG